MYRLLEKERRIHFNFVTSISRTFLLLIYYPSYCNICSFKKSTMRNSPRFINIPEMISTAPRVDKSYHEIHLFAMLKMLKFQKIFAILQLYLFPKAATRAVMSAWMFGICHGEADIRCFYRDIWALIWVLLTSQ